jgi:hypothetical protein
VRFIIICFQPLLLLLVWLCVLRYLHASCVFSTQLIMLHHHQETFCEVDSLLGGSPNLLSAGDESTSFIVFLFIRREVAL